MKKMIIAASMFSLFFTACKETKTVDTAKTENAKEVSPAATAGGDYQVDLATSLVQWTGKKVTGQHSGTFNLSAGALKADANGITGGSFIIDINSLVALDQDPESNTKLGGHLKGADFFDAAKFPTAKFEITAVAPYQAPADTTQKVLLNGATHTVTGNLTLKDVTKSISFPAIVTIAGDQITANSKFLLNRADFNMNYGNDKSLKDKMIYPEVELGLKIVSKK